MQPTVLQGSLSLERLDSADEVRRAALALAAAPTPDAATEGTDGTDGIALIAGIAGGLVVRAGERPLVVVGLRHETPPAGLGLGRLRAVVAGPLLVATTGADAADAADAPDAGLIRAAVRAALRELFVGQGEWHVLRLSGAPDQVIDVAWRLGARLGHACAIHHDLPPERSAEGVVAGSTPVLTFYSPRLKGRLARAADSGLLGMVGGAVGERAAALAGRLGGRRRAPDPESGSRFFALQLDSVPAEPSWGAGITFREVPEAEAAADPLRYSTSVRRMEEALARGDRCFATLVDGELAHHHWVSRDAGFLGRMLPARLLHGQGPTAYPFDSYTFPRFRGRGLQGVTHHWLALHYREAGVERFAVRVSSFNQASMKGILKVGYTEL